MSKVPLHPVAEASSCRRKKEWGKLPVVRAKVGSHGLRASKQLSWDTGGRQDMGGAHDLSFYSCDQDVNTCRRPVLYPIGLCVWILKALCFFSVVPSTADHLREGVVVLL